MPLKQIIKPLYRMGIDMMPARAHVVFDYARLHRRWPNLNNPRRFTEKVAWRKLYDHDPRFPDLVDKVKVKDIIGGKYGHNLIIPTLAVYDNADAMDFNSAPLSKPSYVLKVNHSYRANVFVREPVKPDAAVAIKAKLNKFLQHDHAAVAEEWAYSRVERKIFAEPLLETPEGYLTDYKFHTFDGKVFAIEVVLDRYNDLKETIRDVNWNAIDFEYRHYPQTKENVPPPSKLKDMIDLAQKIGGEFHYARVDLYEIKGEIKFGELTFYPGAGYEIFDPPEWDFKFGDQWKQDWSKRSMD